MDGISADWRKSSYSGTGGGQCVEVGHVLCTVLIRDTTDNGHGPVLRVSAETWREFTMTIGADTALS